MRDVADRGLEPLVVVLSLEHESHQRLTGLPVFGVVHRQQRIADVEFGRLADRADRPHRVVDVLGHVHLLCLRRRIDRDSVVGPIDFAGEEGLVVGRIVPRRRPGDHGLVEQLGVLDRLHRFRRVDDDLVVLVDEIAAERPQAPVHPGIAVSGSVTQRHPARRSILFHRLGIFEKLVGRGRELGEAGLVGRGDPVVDHVPVIADRNVDPFVAARAVCHCGRHPTPVLLAEIVGDIRHVDALLREQVRQRIKTPEEIGAGFRVGGDRGLRLHVVERFAHHRDVHAGRLGEGADQRRERILFRLHETLPAQ